MREQELFRSRSIRPIDIDELLSEKSPASKKQHFESSRSTEKKPWFFVGGMVVAFIVGVAITGQWLRNQSQSPASESDQPADIPIAEPTKQRVAIESENTAQVSLPEKKDSAPTNIANIFETTMQAGEEYLVAGRYQDAKRSFIKALSLHPDHAIALEKKRIAEQQHEAQISYLRGMDLLKEDKLSQAKEAFKSALDVVPEHNLSKQMLDKLNKQQATANKLTAIDTIHRYLKQKQFDKAQNRLEQLQRKYPFSSEVQSLKRHMEVIVRKHKLATWKQQVVEQEAQGAWGQASVLYKNMLKLDPHADFAIQGLKRVEANLAFMHSAERWLADPKRLYSKNARTQATQLLKQFENSQHPMIKEIYARLHAQLVLATKPIVIQLISDEASEVFIIGVGNQGSFKKKQVSLLPGTYSLFAKRTGYRDVRKKIMVLPGETLSWSIASTEKINF